MNIKKLSIVLSSVLALGAMATVASDALATETAAADLGVSASISANCTIGTAPVTFGAYDPIVANKTEALIGTGTVTVTCTTGSSVTITLGQGANPEGTSTDAEPARQMASGTNRLKYSLFSAGTTVWGNTALTGLGDTGTGDASALTVHGSVDAGQNKPAGSYTDTVVATVTF